MHANPNRDTSLTLILCLNPNPTYSTNLTTNLTSDSVADPRRE